MRELDTKGQAFHSPMLVPSNADLRGSLEAALPEPKERKESWLTSTFPSGSEDPEAPLCSAGYQVQDSASKPFTGSSVLFRLACSKGLLKASNFGCKSTYKD